MNFNINCIIKKFKTYISYKYFNVKVKKIINCKITKYLKNKNFKNDNKTNTNNKNNAFGINISPSDAENKNIEIQNYNSSNNNNLNFNYIRNSTKNSILLNKYASGNDINSRKSSNNYDRFHKSDDKPPFSESDDNEGGDSSGNFNKKRRPTYVKTNTPINQNNLNIIGKGSFLYQNTLTQNDFNSRIPSFLDENFSHKVLNNNLTLI